MALANMENTERRFRGILAGQSIELWGWQGVTLEFVDIDLLVVLALTVLVELDVVLDTLGAVSIGLVDLGVLGQLAVGLERTGLVGGVLHDNITLLVLVVTEREEDNVTLVDPDLLAELATNVGETEMIVNRRVSRGK
jgi:hypothetical protein